MKLKKRSRNVRKPDNSAGSSTENSVSSERKRNNNFSNDEIWCLINEYEKNSDSLSFGTRKQTQKCWEEITAAVNEVHPEFKRSVNEIKKKWVGLLHDTKKQYYKAVADAEERGNRERKRLSEVAEVVIRLKGGFTAERFQPRNRINVADLMLTSDDGTTSYSMSYNGSNNGNDFFDCTNDLTSTDLSIVNVIRSVETSVNMLAVKGPSRYVTEDLMSLKRASLALKKREVELLEQGSLERQRLLSEKEKLLELKMRKAQLEIELLKARMRHAVFAPMNVNSNIT